MKQSYCCSKKSTFRSAGLLLSFSFDCFSGQYARLCIGLQMFSGLKDEPSQKMFALVLAICYI